MQKTSYALMFGAILAAQSGMAVAESGVERAAEGAADTVTSPGKVVEGAVEGGETGGPAGAVVGTATGTVKAAGQAVEGAANVGVGAVEAILEPLTGGD